MIYGPRVTYRALFGRSSPCGRGRSSPLYALPGAGAWLPCGSCSYFLPSSAAFNKAFRAPQLNS